MKIRSYIVGIISLVCMLGSCAKIEQGDWHAEDMQICYDVVQDRSAVTKAAGVYPTGESFASYAWYLPDGKEWTDDKADAELYISEAEISYDNANNSWHDLTTSYYWPKAGALTFFSISPASMADAVSLTKDYGFWISDWNVHDHQDVDIMVADIQTDKNANETIGSFTGVPTIFRHKLAMIEGFTFNTFKQYAPGYKNDGSYRKDDRRFFIQSVAIKNILQQGRFVSGSAPGAMNIGLWQVSDGSAANDYIWFSGNEEVVYGMTSESIPANYLGGNSNVLVLPQTFADLGDVDLSAEPHASTVPYIEIQYVTWTYSNNDGSYTTHTTTARAPLYEVLKGVGNRMDMNKKFTFNITINLDSNLIIWAPDQNEWTGNDFNISI